MDLSGAHWRKSSYSGSESNCVEVAFVGDRVAARDSKNPTGPALTFTPTAWTAFLTAVHTEEFQGD
ncbi:MAG TPA: DUF397 domain-containing protein [Pseudonocardiaceae bacterium]|nr:DUF397 domain-containing protein [Pseudonocardiaceae bacterium]